MKVEKIISALCYFSILFAPFLFPLIVFLVTKGEIREHAKRAFLTHIVPFVSLLFLFTLMFTPHVILVVLIIFVLFFALSFVVLIWNLVTGIRMLIPISK